MYYNYTVQIPLVKGKIITKKKGDATYVLFQYGQRYNAEKSMQYLSEPSLASFIWMIHI